MSEHDRIEDLLRAPRSSRRDFMKQAAALGISASAAGALFRSAQAANRGGDFKQALTGGATSDSLDPATINDSYMINVSSGQLRNNLTEIGPDGQLRGELAESWEASADASTWTFKLRPGVEFHNGKTLTAADVVASFNHHRGEDTKSAAKGIVAPIADVKVDGDGIVVFTLNGGNADFPFLCSDYHLSICPATADGTMDWESGVGTGGYVLEAFEPGVRTLVKRNPNYWKPDAAFFESVDNLFIADSTARTSALRTGEIHAMSNIDLKSVHLLKRDTGLQVFNIAGNKHATLPMLTNVAPFDNVDLRLALKYAINRQEFVDKIIKGAGEVGNDNPVGPANIYRATYEELPPKPFDPDKARHHLKKAGYDTIDVTLHVADSAFEGAVDAGQLYAETAKKAGINIKVAREPDDGYWSNVWLVKPWCASYWGGRPTEDWLFSQIYSKGADWNETKWDNERFNKLLVEARAELEPARRREMYVEMQRLVAEEGGAVVPMFMAYTHAVTANVQLPEQIANNWELDGHKNAERWSFKA